MPIFTSFLHIWPSDTGFSGEIGLREPKATSDSLMLIRRPHRCAFRMCLLFHLTSYLSILDYMQHSDPLSAKSVKHFITALQIFCAVASLRWTFWMSASCSKTLSESGLSRKGADAYLKWENCRRWLRTCSCWKCFVTRLRLLKLTMGEAYSDILALCTTPHSLRICFSSISKPAQKHSAVGWAPR